MSSPSPARSIRSRMGTMMRRSSSALSFIRPNTPTPSEKKTSPPASEAPTRGSVDSERLRPEIDVNTTPSQPPPHILPSPIAESPAREEAAGNEEADAAGVVGPSPLAAPPVTAAVDESVGPGGFTDEPEEIDAGIQTSPVKETKVEHVLEAVPEERKPELAPEEPVQPEALETAGSDAKEDHAEEVKPEPEHEPEPTRKRTRSPSPSRLSEAEEPMEVDFEPGPKRKRDRSPSPAAEERTPAPPTASFPEPSPMSPNPPDQPSYFDPTITHEIVVVPTPPSAFKAMVTEDALPSEETIRPVAIAVIDESASPMTPVVPGHLTDSPPRSIPITVMPEPVHKEGPRDYILDESQDIWRTDGEKGKAVEHRHGYNVDAEDPFADPPGSHPVGPDNSEPSHQEEEHYRTIHIMDTSNRALHQVPSIATLQPAPSQAAPSSRAGHYEHEIDETHPLLERPRTPQLSYLNGHAGISIPFPTSSSTALTTTSRLQQLGWLEYDLPDGTVYYVHPTLRVTTDVDLRDQDKLNEVSSYFDLNHQPHRFGGKGVELWLREVDDNKKKRKVKQEKMRRFWVDHTKREVKADVVWEGGADGVRRGKIIEEDALDMEYRYWCFMESHPAHASLPSNARADAMDVLTWSWTDRLLPPQRSAKAPFTQEECQELMTLLRSFGDNQHESGLQGVVHTRVVSRILLRVAQWRQERFRPQKSLPTDAAAHKHGEFVAKKTFPRLVSDFLLSCVCLGIPYFVFSRTVAHQHYIRDEESLRMITPMVMVGASTCLVAAIVLSTSVTFLSLSGLDPLARLAGLVAALFAAFSIIASAFLVVVRADRNTVGGEGMMVFSTRHILMSLPATFLAYSIIAFLAAITLYSFRGNAEELDEYTKWTVVGVLGGLVFVTFALLAWRSR